MKNAIPLGSRVMTKDGPGKTIGMDHRKASNGGPGTRQYVVELDDGRKRHYPMNMQPITPEAVRDRNNTHPFSPKEWRNNHAPDMAVSWWVTRDKAGYFHAALLAVDTDKDGDFITEWSPEFGWCGLSGDMGAPLP